MEQVQPSQTSKAPRIIRIESQAESMLLEQTTNGVFLTAERIADMVAEYHEALKRRRQKQISEVWDVIHELYPETQEGRWSFDPYKNILIEIVDEPESTPENMDSSASQPNG